MFFLSILIFCSFRFIALMFVTIFRIFRLVCKKISTYIVRLFIIVSIVIRLFSLVCFKIFIILSNPGNSASKYAEWVLLVYHPIS